MGQCQSAKAVVITSHGNTKGRQSVTTTSHIDTSEPSLDLSCISDASTPETTPLSPEEAVAAEVCRRKPEDIQPEKRIQSCPKLETMATHPALPTQQPRAPQKCKSEYHALHKDEESSWFFEYMNDDSEDSQNNNGELNESCWGSSVAYSKASSQFLL